MRDANKNAYGTSDGTTTLPVCDELSIYAAASLKAELLTALAATDTLVVDLSGVTVLDGAGLQLLIMLKREALSLGKTVCFSGHSEAVLKVLDLTNLAGYFGDPLVLAAESSNSH